MSIKKTGDNGAITPSSKIPTPTNNTDKPVPFVERVAQEPKISSAPITPDEAGSFIDNIPGNAREAVELRHILDTIIKGGDVTPAQFEKVRKAFDTEPKKGSSFDITG